MANPIPRGVEVLVRKASVDPAFKDLLLTAREAAASQIDLELDAGRGSRAPAPCPPDNSRP